MQDEVTKADAIQDAGISRSQAYDLQAMAANPEVVQAVLDKAEADGTIPSRSQVLKAIKERNEAAEQAKSLKSDLADALKEIDALERQNDQLYAQVDEQKQPQVIERVVESDAAKKRISELEHLEQLHSSDNQKLRKKNEELRRELDKAKDMLGMDKTLQDVRRDVQYLTSATNQYVRQYGGLTWTAASFEQVDAQALVDLRKAVINLATFANALVASLEEFNG